MDCLNELIERLRKEQVVLFIGSGFSFKAGGPSSSELVDAIKAQMGEAQKISLYGNQLDYVSSEYEQMYGRDSLLQIIEEKMNFTRKDISDHLALTQIPHFHTIITTNYDTLLEDAYGDNCFVVRTSEDCMNLPSSKVRLFKIHGDFKAKDNIILTKEDYTNYFTHRKNNNLWTAVTSEMLLHDVLFMGYSLEDNNIFELVKAIKEDAPNNKHNFYVVAPNLHKYKIKRLEASGLRYIDKRAEEILDEIITVLNKKITRDFRNRRVSFDTFVKYCHIHGINPTLKPGTDDAPNTVTSFDIQKPGKVDVHFSLPKETAIAIRDINFEKRNENLEIKKNDIGVPYCTLTTDLLRDFEMSINNVVTLDQDSIRELMILPRTHNLEAAIRIPSIGFNEKVTLTLYGSIECCHTLLSTEIYNIDMTIRPTKEESEFSVSFKDKYKNNSNAIKWVEFLIALCSGETVYSTAVLTTFAVKKNNELESLLQNMKQYYKNLNEIECRYNVVFDKYENYTAEKYRLSCLLLAICDEGYLDVSYKYNKEPFSVDTTKTPRQLHEMSIEIGQHFALKFSQDVLNPYVLCGKEFRFKNRITIIYDAEIMGTSTFSDEITKIILCSRGSVYEVYTDKEIESFFDSVECHTIPLK